MQAKGRQFGRTWRRRGWGTHVYMHCIAKTLLTELHLAILVPRFCVYVTFPPTAQPPSPSLSCSASLRRHLRLSFTRSEIRRVSTYAKSYSIRLREIPYDGGELMARLMAWGAVGRWMSGGGTERTGDERDGAGFQESENGIPESLILLVNKCLGDSLLVHSYRPSFVSRRHCVLRFYLVFRSNGFWGPSRVASRVPHIPSPPSLFLVFSRIRDFLAFFKLRPCLKKCENFDVTDDLW